MNTIFKNLTCETNNNTIFKLDSCKSDSVFVHFWATWCGPCRNEIPELEKIYLEYKNKIDFIFISCDNNKSTIDNFITNQKLTIPIGYDFDGSISNKIGIRSIPSSFFIKKTDSDIIDIKNIVGAMDYFTLKKKFSEFLQ